MDRTTAALQEALSPLGVTVEPAPRGARRRRGSDAAGPVLVTRHTPRSRVHLATMRARVDSLVQVRHAAVVEVLGGVLLRDAVVVAERELPGPDLATLLRGRATWEVDEVRGVVADLADGLAALRAAHLVHGDVAPGNVVLDARGRAVLVDLVRGAGSDELGTPGWAAPERSDGATPAADVYSLGTLAAALLARCVDDDVVLREAVARCVTARPEDRPTADELARTVRGAGPTSPVTRADPSRLAGALLQEQAVRDCADERTVRRPRRARGRYRRRGLARGVLVPAVLGVVVLGAAVVALRGAYGPERAESGAAPPAVAPVEPRGARLDRPDDAAALRAARGLTLRRAAALSRGSLPTLLSVTEPGSVAAGADRELWRPGGVGGADVTVRRARVISTEAGEWRVAVGVQAGGVSQDVVLRLVADGDRWAVRAVEEG